jgi:uncharacterized membrane protein
MRKPLTLLLEITSLAALLFLWIISIQAITGANHLPDKIPTHFDLAGNPNAWGSAKGILLLPAIATGLYLLITIVSRYPASFNYPVRITAQNRDRIYALGVQMVSFLKAETICLFALINYSILQAFRAGHSSLHIAIIPFGVGIILVTTLTHILLIVRAK